MADTILLRSLRTQCTPGPDAWGRMKPQPIILSISLTFDTTSAGASDDVAETFSYGQMGKEIVAKVEGSIFADMDHLVQVFPEIGRNWPGTGLRLCFRAPEGLLRCEGGLGREVVMVKTTTKSNDKSRETWHIASYERSIQGLKLACIIGVNPHERLEKQTVILTLRFRLEHKQSQSDNMDTRHIVRQICEVVEPSSFQTLEALAALVAGTCLKNCSMPQVTVSIEKPSAMTFVEGAGVEITRDRSFLQHGT